MIQTADGEGELVHGYTTVDVSGRDPGIVLRSTEPETVQWFLDEMERDLSIKVIETKAPSGKEAILEVLARAADDHKFLARLA